jgi:hypothetical protein
MFTKTTVMGIAVALILAGCAMAGPEDDYQNSGQAMKGATPVEILEVGYGGTTVNENGEKVILPEFVILFNFGKSAVNIGGFLLSDGGNWGGDGAVRFPQGTVIHAGDMLVVANYPPVTFFESYWGYRQISFEEAYGYTPDMEIAGWNPELEDLEHVAGRIRLKHRHCTYDADCWAVTETVYLIDGTRLSDQEAVEMLASGNISEDLLISVFPENE